MAHFVSQMSAYDFISINSIQVSSIFLAYGLIEHDIYHRPQASQTSNACLRVLGHNLNLLEKPHIGEGICGRLVLA